MTNLWLKSLVSGTWNWNTGRTFDSFMVGVHIRLPAEARSAFGNRGGEGGDPDFQDFLW